MRPFKNFVYSGMPLPAPRTPALEKIVDQLSKLLWTMLPVTILGVIQIYLNKDSRAGISVGGAVAIGIFVGAIYWFLIWHYDSWIKGLQSRDVKLPLEKSGRQLHGFMNVLMFFGTWAVLGSGFLVFTVLKQPINDSWQPTVASILQLLNAVSVVLGAAAAKAWFRTGYTTEPLPQRPRLLLALRAYAVITGLKCLMSIIRNVGPLRELTDWISLVLNLAASIGVIWGVVLTIKLVEATFAVPGARQVESNTVQL